jgi:hypothetical protein
MLYHRNILTFEHLEIRVYVKSSVKLGAGVIISLMILCRFCMYKTWNERVSIYQAISFSCRPI